MKRIGEDVAEKLNYIPGTFTVERHIRGKWACAKCETLVAGHANCLPLRVERLSPSSISRFRSVSPADQKAFRQAQYADRRLPPCADHKGPDEKNDEPL